MRAGLLEQDVAAPANVEFKSTNNLLSCNVWECYGRRVYLSTTSISLIRMNIDLLLMLMLMFFVFFFLFYFMLIKPFYHVYNNRLFLFLLYMWHLLEYCTNINFYSKVTNSVQFSSIRLYLFSVCYNHDYLQQFYRNQSLTPQTSNARKKKVGAEGKCRKHRIIHTDSIHANSLVKHVNLKILKL